MTPQHLNMRSTIFGIIFIAIISCHSTSKPMTTYNAPALKVEIHDLLKNIGKYHNKLIETEGVFHSGFEELAIYSQGLFLSGKDTIKRIDNFSGLWIESNLTYPEAEKFYDSLQNKFINVKGVIDTTRTGHLGNYRATLTKTDFIRTSD